MTLGDAKVGSTVVVTKIEGDSAYKRRIMDMGITKGSELYIRKVAPLGDPVEITVRGYELSVRKNDAQCVQVNKYAVVFCKNYYEKMQLWRRTQLQ